MYYNYFMKYIINNLEEMNNFAHKIAKKLVGGENIILHGDLGAGKTTLTKLIAKWLGVEEVVTSPTFMFMKSYKSGRLPLYHFDMYRVEDEDELLELGLNDYLYAGGVCVIEWNKFKNVPNAIEIKIVVVDENIREVEGDECFNN